MPEGTAKSLENAENTANKLYTHLKILAVDDDPTNLKIVGLSLGKKWKIQTAKSGEEALKVANEIIPHLILLDIMMPGIDGYEVCRQIKSDPKFVLTKIILVSGRATIEERLKGYKLGADDYLIKPFVPGELEAKVRVFLRLSETESQLRESLGQINLFSDQLIQAEASLIQSSKLTSLGEMSTSIAHEVSNPLASILLNVDLIRNSLRSGDIDCKKLINKCEVIKTTIERITQIVRGLRSLARDGAQDPFLTVSVETIVEESIAICKHRLRDNSIRFDYVPVPKNLQIDCRSVQIVQVLVNLLNNSVDAVTHLHDRWIKLEIENLPDQIKLILTDSGNGIPEAIRGKIMDTFFTTKPVGSGTGLGLGIAKKIILYHQGQFSLNSDCKNTQFVIVLPKKHSPNQI